ncbi:uncharacterized protein LOC120601916 [Pteropus medius]|uniref:uncharacterized protein LOC120601916 n=1 Tax=Pteropus vampyrus TaxID=132908 RepID=UPI00196B6B57|nr:uncharacterized protein LOC120601916 [Pteropus giganteus]
MREGGRRVRFSQDVTIYTFDSEKAPATTGVQQLPRLPSSAEIISALKAYDRPSEKRPSTTRAQKRFRFLSNVEVPSAFMAYDRPGIKGRCMEEESRTQHVPNIYERGSENRAQRVRFSPQVTEHFIDQEDEAPATTGVQPLPRLPSSAEIPSALKAYDRRSEKRTYCLITQSLTRNLGSEEGGPFLPIWCGSPCDPAILPQE